MSFVFVSALLLLALAIAKGNCDQSDIWSKFSPNSFISNSEESSSSNGSSSAEGTHL